MSSPSSSDPDVSPTVAPAAPVPPAKPASKRLPITLAVLGLVGLGGFGWYYSHRFLQNTDDAQVDADVTAVPARTAALVEKVLFVENQQVKEGDVLVELDSEPAKARLAQAEANLDAAKATADAADADARVAETNARGNKTVAEASLQGAASSASATKDQISESEAALNVAKANLDKAKLDLDRSKDLLASGSVAQANLDQSKATYDAMAAAEAQARAHVATLKATTSQANAKVQEANGNLEKSRNVDVLIEQARARARSARASVATAQAMRDLSALDLSYTKITAPQGGVVSKKTVTIGQMVAAGQIVVSLIPNSPPWVTGNFKETQLERMKIGQSAEVEVDAFPGVKIHGSVESFSGATGARFSLLPPDNASGNYTKIVQRVPVRIRLTDLPQGVSLRPGMSVDLTVDTAKLKAES